VWRYGYSDAARDKYGDNYVVVGCSKNTADLLDNKHDETRLCKWLVNVESPGCKGLFYRSAPNVIAPDADWPRNGDIILGSEIPNIPGWCCSYLDTVSLKFIPNYLVSHTPASFFSHQHYYIFRLDTPSKWILFTLA
jgi:hypothetical protein